MTACVTYERRVEKPRAASSVGVGRLVFRRPRYVRLAASHITLARRCCFRVSLRIFEQKRDCSQSTTAPDNCKKTLYDDLLSLLSSTCVIRVVLSVSFLFSFLLCDEFLKTYFLSLPQLSKYLSMGHSI